MESGGWWSTFVFGVAIEGNISIFSDWTKQRVLG
jgi:hypothetical protein